MFRHDPNAVLPVSDVLIARAPIPGGTRREVEKYRPEHDAGSVTGFACWKIPRGWLVVCLTEQLTIHPERDIWALRELYLLKRTPDVKGTIQSIGLIGTLQMTTIWKTRGRYAANAPDIRRILRAILAD